MKYICERIRSLFRLEDSPHRLASAFALGVFIAFSPVLGLHTITCIIFAWTFRLNKLVVLSAAFINNPWTIVPMYGFCLWFGTKIVGNDTPVPPIAWNELTLTNIYLVLKPFLIPFVAGTVLVGLLAALVSYTLIYWGVLRYREHAESPNRDAD